jgi:hypothetical protein
MRPTGRRSLDSMICRLRKNAGSPVEVMINGGPMNNPEVFQQAAKRFGYHGERVSVSSVGGCDVVEGGAEVVAEYLDSYRATIFSTQRSVSMRYVR